MGMEAVHAGHYADEMLHEDEMQAEGTRQEVARNRAALRQHAEQRQQPRVHRHAQRQRSNCHRRLRMQHSIVSSGGRLRFSHLPYELL